MMLAMVILIAAPIACDGDLPQQMLNQCLAKDFAEADAELNKVWKPAYSEMQRMDRDTGESGYAQAVLASQRAWIAYRDAQCVTEANAMRDGSGEAMLLFGCKGRLTRERTMYLRSIVEGN